MAGVRAEVCESIAYEAEQYDMASSMKASRQVWVSWVISYSFARTVYGGPFLSYVESSNTHLGGDR